MQPGQTILAQNIIKKREPLKKVLERKLWGNEDYITKLTIWKWEGTYAGGVGKQWTWLTRLFHMVVTHKSSRVRRNVERVFSFSIWTVSYLNISIIVVHWGSSIKIYLSTSFRKRTVNDVVLWKQSRFVSSQ